jgi:predicted nucleic acid-binding protein
MRDAVLVDAGPLVALLDRSDPHHLECSRALQGIHAPLLTVGPAVTEAMFLLGFSSKAQSTLLEMVQLETLRLAPLDASDMPRIRALMAEYKDRRMDFADASLVRVAEREKLTRIFTVDRRDFTVYRLLKTGRFSILP